MKILLSIIMYFYALFFLFIVILIYPIFKIKIGNIQSRTMEMDQLYEIFYYEMKERSKKKWVLYMVYWKKISNEFIIKKFKENFVLYPEFYCSLHLFDKKVKVKFFTSSNRKQKYLNRDDNEAYQISKLINFNQSEISYYKKIYKIFDIKDDKIICACEHQNFIMKDLNLIKMQI